MAGLRSTVYALLLNSDARKQGYDEGEVLSIVITTCDRHAMAGAEEKPCHLSKVVFPADVASCS